MTKKQTKQLDRAQIKKPLISELSRICGFLLFSIFAFQVTAQVDLAVTGELETLILEYPDQGKAETQHYVVDKNSQKRWRLMLKTDPKVPPGSLIRARGQGNSRNELALDGGDSGMEVLQEAQVAALSGNRTAIALIVDFQDSSVSCSEATVGSTLFASNNSSSVVNYMTSASHGVVSLSGEVHRVQISAQSSSGTCDYSAWSSAANAAAADAGISVSGFNHRIYVLPSNVSCGWAGLGTLGGGQTWVKTCNNARVYAHELGHNFGMHHASAGTSEYGDGSDVMGGAYRELNSAHKVQMGWTDRVRTVSTSGSFRVSPLGEAPGQALDDQILRIFKEDTNEYYFVSYRTKMGTFDGGLSSTYADKINVHRYRGSGGSKTYFLSAHAVGGVFADSANGIEVRVADIQSGHAMVDVTISRVCNKRAPTVSLSPSSRSSSPGQTVDYTVNVMNNNSTYCDNVTFNLSATLPADLAAVFSSTSVSMASGTTASSIVSVTTSPLIGSGTYTFDVVASDSSEPSPTGSASASLIIDGEAPTAPTNVIVTGSRKNRVDISWSASSDNVGISHYEILRDGAVIGQSTSTSYSDGPLASGTYTYGIMAVDQSGNKSPISATVIYTLVEKGGGGGKGGGKGRANGSK